VSWSRDGKLLATGDDAEVIVWDATTYETRHTLTTPGKGLVAFTPDGRTLLTARHHCLRGQCHAFTRWDVTTGTPQATWELPTGGGLAFFHLSPDGRTLFVSQADPARNCVRAYDAETGTERHPEEGHEAVVQSVAFSPDGRTLASGSHDRTVRLWDLAAWESGLPPCRVLSGHADTVWSLAFSPDGALLATSGSRDGLLFLWDAATGRKLHDLAGHSRVLPLVAFSPDGTTVAAGGGDGTVNRWDVRTGQRKEPLRFNAGPVRSVAFSPDGQVLASGDGHTVQVIDLEAGRRLHTFRGERLFTNLAFSPNGKTLAAASEAPNARLRLWNVETGEEQPARTGHTNHILGLSLHPGGRTAATASWDGTVRLWDLRAENRPGRTIDFTRFGGQVHGIAFSPEGRHLAVGNEHGLVSILRVPDLSGDTSP
jgi:WD40 repeat protein